ncbi:MAG: hypothetical protein H7X80_02315 [bacterium]|nr:hypothetical protein [Candidatus Kapabacteria bacterium]
MKTHILFIAALALALGSAACNSGTQPDAIDIEILPLDNGNQWIGDYTVYDSTGAVLRRGVDTTRLENGRVLGVDRFGLLADHRVVTNRDGGLYIGSDDAPADQWLYLKYPAQSGARSVRSSGLDGGRAVIVNLISTNESITVGAGTFATYHYETTETNNAYVAHTFMAPSVGFVRTELRDRPGDRWNLGSMVWELREVRLAR